MNKLVAKINKIQWEILRRKFQYAGRNGFVAGGSVNLVGSQYVRMGEGFSCGKNMTLQAWDTYQGFKTGLTPLIEIGNQVSVMANFHVSCIGHIQIGNKVLIGDNVFICDNFHGDPASQEERSLSPKDRPLYYKGEIQIEDCVWIGRNVCIFGNVHIGKGAIVGANAVITHDVPAFSTVGGVPAHIL